MLLALVDQVLSAPKRRAAALTEAVVLASLVTPMDPSQDILVVSLPVAGLQGGVQAEEWAIWDQAGDQAGEGVVEEGAWVGRAGEPVGYQAESAGRTAWETVEEAAGEAAEETVRETARESVNQETVEAGTVRDTLSSS